MSAALTDNFMEVAVAGSLTTMASPGKALAATSINVASGSGWPTTTGFIVAIRTVDNSGNLVPGTYTEWIGTISGTTITLNPSPVYGTDQVYVAGSTTQVFIPLSSYGYNLLIAALLQEHTQAGLHTLGSSSKLTSTKVITGLTDTNGKKWLDVAATSNAVNEVQITNAATGNPPQVAAVGTDANIDLQLAAKGTGVPWLLGGIIKGLLSKRQGGDAANWSTAGSTTFDTSAAKVMIQVGSHTFTTTSDETITYPTAFSNVPVVFTSLASASGHNGTVRTPTQTATNFTVRFLDITGNAQSGETTFWLAIGAP